MCGGEEEGGSTLVEEVEEEEEEQAGGPAGPGWGLTDLLPSPGADWPSSEAPPHPSEEAFDWLLSPAARPVAPPFSLVFFPRRRRRLVAREDDGEEAEEEVEVMELGLVFLFLSPAGLVKDDGGGGARAALFPNASSLPRPLRDSGSEHGLRNGERLSLSLQNTTAIEPPTTELAEPPLAPPAPSRSMGSFPEPTAPPVVLLTPSRTSTDTLDCSFPLRLAPPSFFDFPERPSSFLPPFSRSLSFPPFLALLGAGPEEEAEPEVTIIEERHLFLVLLEAESDRPVFLKVRDFFF